ncbi:MAG: hypothetical protein U9O98_03365 [Asgard group archaeon]|nr:hypothetical protein [Asgard group archaeon]
MVIEERDLPLLISLQQHPLAPASNLAKELGVSTPTVISRLEHLKEEKSYYSVYANIQPFTLNLEIVDVILNIENLENIQFIENVVCFKHPFTLFRIRCFGKSNGLFLQFRIPKGTKNKLIQLFDELKKENKIIEYFLPNYTPNMKKIVTNANLLNWEHKLMRWSFNWDDWIRKMDNIKPIKLEYKKQKNYLSQLDELDIALLQELTMNARRKNTEIMSALNLDKNEVGLPQKVSRKLKFLDKNIISQYRVFLRWETFEIYNSFLIISNCSDKIKFKLQNLLQKEPIPFESLYKITNEGFMWYLRCPSSHFSDVSEFVLSMTEKVQFYFLDYKTSEFYGLWKGAFDPDNHIWETNLMDIDRILS